METLRKHLLRDGVYTFANVMGMQTKEASNGIEVGTIVLTFLYTT